MQKYDCLQFRDSPLHSARGPVELFSQPFNGDAVDQTALDDSAVALGMDVLVNDRRHVCVRVLRL